MPTRANLPSAGQSGFTIIELLVVLLILAALAAIGLPSFIGQRDKAGDAQAKEQVKAAQVAAETYFTDRQTYAGLSAAALRSIEPTLNDATLTGITGAASTYTVGVRSRSAVAGTFTLSRAASGRVTSSCNRRGRGGCPSNGRWAG
ncbi:MAG: prepilin-type N-terminal cleavage/methylation domain-containing protein [Solirubrobacteraceae bacterium]